MQKEVYELATIGLIFESLLSDFMSRKPSTQDV